MNGDADMRIAERYQLEERAGAGGMGVVWRATDLLSGETVALKVLRANARELPTRFLREAAVLSELRHETVVRYIDHGLTAAGEPYLVMEWLDGEGLDTRIRRGPLAIDDGLTIARRILTALSAAHRRGIVHRDLKPANVFLPGGEPSAAKLLDFGIAKRLFEVSKSGKPTVVGTPYYMSPEQARGQAELDGRSDIFSFGSLLYECLVGAPPFRGDTVMAVLAKVCVADPPRLRDARPDVPVLLERLIERTLAKKPENRPADVDELTEELNLHHDTPTSGPSDTLSEGEQRVMCVLMAAQPRRDDAATASEAVETERLTTDGVSQELARLGGQTHALLDGSIVVTVGERGTPADLAARAARCALTLRALAPGVVCAISTGRARVVGRLPLGRAIDEAVESIADAQPGQVRIDDATAALIGDRFIERREGSSWLLEGERVRRSKTTVPAAPGNRPFLGRDHELASLDATYEAVVDGGRARGVVVTGPPGSGKTRLQAEFLRRLAERPQPPMLVAGRGDAMRTGVPYGVLGGALADTMGIDVEQTPFERRGRLAVWLRERVPGHDISHTRAFLGEIVGAPTPEGDDPLLQLARRDPRIMAEHIATAVVTTFRAIARRPVALVIEDMQWADPPSLQLVDTLLRDLVDAPLFLLALARSDSGVEEANPWRERAVHRLVLHKLDRRPCRDLARAIVGDIAEHDIEWLVERSDGNPFFLEELARALKTRGRTAIPDAVLGTVQSRLDELPSEARKLLRAGSVFGMSFGRTEVAALLANDDVRELDRWLEMAINDDLLVRLPHGGHAYGFRHALIRDAAYESLTEGDRVLGHRMAGQWLADHAAAPPPVLVEHFERAGDKKRAAVFCVRAGAALLAGGDLDGAIGFARRGARLDASRETSAELGLLESKALRWKGAWNDGALTAARAMKLRERGAAGWFQTAEQRVMCLGDAGAARECLELARELVDAQPRSPDAASARLLALAATAGPLLIFGLHADAKPIFDLIERADRETLDGATRARILFALGRLAQFEGRMERALKYYDEAGHEARATGEALTFLECANNQATACLDLGAWSEAEQTLLEVRDMAIRLQLKVVEGAAMLNLALARFARRDFRDGWLLLDHGRTLLASWAGGYAEAVCAIYAATGALADGDLTRAMAESERAIGHSKNAVPYQPYAMAVRADVLLATGDLDGALTAARESRRLVDEDGVRPEEGELATLVILADVLGQAGHRVEAQAVLRQAIQVIESRARSIEDPRYRASFLNDVPINARARRLAATLGLAAA